VFGWEVRVCDLQRKKKPARWSFVGLASGMAYAIESSGLGRSEVRVNAFWGMIGSLGIRP
jgi:hypothetical protein